MTTITELKITTVEELHAYISSIFVMQPIEPLSGCPSTIALPNAPSYIDIHKDVLNILDLKVFEILWNNQIYFKAYDFNSLYEDNPRLFQIVKSILKYDLNKGITYDSLKNDYDFPKVLNQLSHEQISALISDNLITIKDIDNSLKYIRYPDCSNLASFLIHNGWNIADKGLPVPIKNINLETIRLALKKGLKPEYVIEHLNEVYDFTTQLKFISAAVDSGYKLHDLDWGKLKVYVNYITDINDINIELLVAAVKNHKLTSQQIGVKIENIQQKTDFVSTVSAMGEDLNNLEPKIFIGLSTNQIKTCLEQGLKLEKLIPILPELCKAFDLKSGLLTSLASLGLEPKAFLQDNIPIATYAYLDIGSLQLLLDNGASVDDMARKIFQAIIHYGTDYQETLKVSLQYLVAKGADVAQIGLPMTLLDNYKETLINAQSATAILKSALQAEITTWSYPSGYQLDKAKLASQQNVIQEAIKQGADINAVLNQAYSVTLNALEALEYNKDILLDHTSANGFLKIVLKASITSYNVTTYHQEMDPEKVKVQAELVKEALDKGADINVIISSNDFYNLNLSLQCLAQHKEFLFNTAKPITAQNFLKLVLKVNANSEADIALQDQLVKEALDRSADINELDHVSFEGLIAHKEILLNHPTNSLGADKLLKWALQADVTTYDHTAQKYITDLGKVKIQGELVKEALDKGVDINPIISGNNFYQFNLSLQFSAQHKELLFSSAKPITTQNFLKLVLKVNASSEADIALQGVLLKEMLDKGVDINAILNGNDFYQINLSLQFLAQHKELLFSSANPITAQNFLKLVLKFNANTEPDIALQGELLKEALDKGADINELDSIPFESLIAHRDLLLDHPKRSLSADKLLKLALEANVNTYDSAIQKEIADLGKVKIQGELIKEALDKGAKFSDDEEAIEALAQATSFFTSLFYNKELLLEHPTNPLLPEILIKLVLESMNSHNRHYDINGELIVDHEKIGQQNSLIKYAIEKGADLNFKIFENEDFSFTLFEQLFASNRFGILNLAQEINPYANYTLSTLAWLAAIDNNYNIGFITNALQKFTDGFSKEEANNFLRAHGLSHSLIDGIFDIYDLAEEVVKATVDQQSSVLSSTELQILDINKNISLADCTNGEYKNSFGFSSLSLALLTGKFELAIKMIENEFSLTEKNNNGITPIQIIGKLLGENQLAPDHAKALKEVMFEKLDNLDIILNEQGESLIDNFLNDPNCKDEALERTNDPLFTFYKPNADLFIPSLHPKQTHIAISMGEGFWSTGLNAASRLISKEHPEVTFHLVTLEMMVTGGDKFISQFNGWVNPGAGDSFPKGKGEFNKNDWEQSMVLEQAYQKALEKTHEFKIPYIGMCAGAQNFALYHEGYLHPLKGYAGGNHTMYFKPTTLPHFMVMTKEQQKHALNNCEFPDIAFKGDTAHHYAAVAHKLGNGLQLGAVSEDGIAMAYAHENGLRYATQFHPEHYYHMPYDKHGGINHQKVWVENFIHLTILHHKHIKQGHDHPEIIFDHISSRLEECIKAPICLIEQNIFSNSTITQALFD